MSNAIILIDFETYKNNDAFSESISTNMLNLLDNVRCPVIFVYYYPNKEIKLWDPDFVNEKVYRACKHSPALYNNGSGYYEHDNRTVIDPRAGDHEARVIEILKKHNVKNLYFCGFSLPGCVYNRPLGIENFRNLGFNCSAVIDCCMVGHIVNTTIHQKIHYCHRFCASLNIPVVYHDMFDSNGNVHTIDYDNAYLGTVYGKKSATAYKDSLNVRLGIIDTQNAAQPKKE